MKLIALTLCRNEEWAIRACLTASLRWCDGVVALDHRSTDTTPAIIDEVAAEHPGRVTYLRSDDEQWREMDHRQQTLEAARSVGATHCAIIDADEMLTENLVPTIRDLIGTLHPGEVLQIPWIHCWRSLDKWRDDDSAQASAMVSFAFRDEPPLHWEAMEDGYTFHHRHPYRSFARQVGHRSEGGLFHLQHVHWPRLVAKQRHYMMLETVLFGEVRANYRGTMNEDGLRLSDVPADWKPPEFALLRPELPSWHEQDMERMIREHGPEKFAGVLA